MSAPVMAHRQRGVSPRRSMPYLRSRRLLRRREAGWGATLGELAVRRITNPIRRCDTASLLIHGEAWKSPAPLSMAKPTRVGCHGVVGGGMSGRRCAVSGDTCSGRRTQGRSQNPHSTASRGTHRQGEDSVAPAGNQPATEKTKTRLNLGGGRGGKGRLAKPSIGKGGRQVEA